MTARAPAGAIQRAISTVMIGTAQKMKARDAREAQVALEEFDLQYQLPVSGIAGTIIGFSSIDIEFEHDFFYAPGQRDSELTVPQFHFGPEIPQDVMVTASVADWLIDNDNGAIHGATVKVAVLGAAEENYSGKIHVTFQGWGGLREPDSDLG